MAKKKAIERPFKFYYLVPVVMEYSSYGVGMRWMNHWIKKGHIFKHWKEERTQENTPPLAPEPVGPEIDPDQEAEFWHRDASDPDLRPQSIQDKVDQTIRTIREITGDVGSP